MCAESVGRLFVIGIGPGSVDDLTERARRTLDASEVIVGYRLYLDLIAPLTAGKTLIAGGMGAEIERCEAALGEACAGRTVALVSSGDAGIYGMAGLVLQMALARDLTDRVSIEVVPGVPAFVAAAALAGAPLMHDFAAISLSDLLTPWGLIEKRLRAAAAADFVTCLYNPRSTGRTTQIEHARDIFLAQRSADTPCAIVRNASRADQRCTHATLISLPVQEIDMFCVVIIGNSQTRTRGSWMITPRGYERKA